MTIGIKTSHIAFYSSSLSPKKGLKIFTNQINSIYLVWESFYHFTHISILKKSAEFLAVQWLGLDTFTARGLGLIPWLCGVAKKEMS